MTVLIADGHVHIYREYVQTGLLEHAREGLTALAGRAGDDVAFGLFLTERAGDNFFAGLQGRHVCESVVEQAGLLIFAGRQIATAERMEVLALCSQAQIQDGLPLAETVQEVQTAGGIPVIPWSPGKWMFKRKSILQKLLSDSPPGAVLLGDSSLRPRGVPEPHVMTQARTRGFGIVAGTDPFPFAGQERVIGSYGFCIDNFDRADPLGSLKRELLHAHPRIELLGHRASLLGAAQRLLRNKLG